MPLTRRIAATRDARNQSIIRSINTQRVAATACQPTNQREATCRHGGRERSYGSFASLCACLHACLHAACVLLVCLPACVPYPAIGTDSRDCEETPQVAPLASFLSRIHFSPHLHWHATASLLLCSLFSAGVELLRRCHHQLRMESNHSRC